MVKKKKKKKYKRGEYSSTHQKIARRNSGNTITALKFLRKLDNKNDTINTNATSIEE